VNKVAITAADARGRAAVILDKAVFHARHLRECLQDEQIALAEQDLDALMNAIEEKGLCVRELQKTDTQRSALCLAAGFADCAEQMRDFTEWCDEEAVLARSWDELLTVASECNSLNLSNGAVIRIRKQHIEEGISVLRGTDPASPIYNRSGGNRDGLGNRAIAEA
jgi:flagellar biosynthesis/type III secretory pathway chaperone